MLAQVWQTRLQSTHLDHAFQKFARGTTRGRKDHCDARANSTASTCAEHGRETWKTHRVAKMVQEAARRTDLTLLRQSHARRVDADAESLRRESKLDRVDMCGAGRRRHGSRHTQKCYSIVQRALDAPCQSAAECCRVWDSKDASVGFVCKDHVFAVYLISTSDEHASHPFFSMMAARTIPHIGLAMHKDVQATRNRTRPLCAPIVSVDDARGGPLKGAVELELRSRGTPSEPTGVWKSSDNAHTWCADLF